MRLCDIRQVIYEKLRADEGGVTTREVVDGRHQRPLIPSSGNAIGCRYMQQDTKHNLQNMPNQTASSMYNTEPKKHLLCCIRTKCAIYQIKSHLISKQ